MEIEDDPDLFLEADLFGDVGVLDVEDEISMILTDMNLAEKVGQMTQLALSAISISGSEELDPERVRDVIVNRHVGSIFNIWTSALAPEEWHEVIATIQEVALLESRLGIPIIYGIDSVHGANYTYGATLFPHNLGLAATWDPSIAEAISVVSAQETAACGIRWAFAPVLDLGRQPLWSRFVETFGEDALLATRMGRAAVNGFGQESGSIAACAKHYIGYGNPRSGHDRTQAVIPEHELRDWFLPPFTAAVSAGVSSVMVNSGELNGEPVHASRRLLTGLLREELGFDGVIVSDWEDIIRLHTVHRVAASEKEATRLAIEAGVDISMTPHSLSFCEHLCELVEEGAISENRIDESVRRILRLKHRLGLFDQPFPVPDEISRIGSASAIDLSYKAALSSITVLKNDRDLLPLSENAKMLVTGPASDSPAALHGPWSYTWQGADDDFYPDDSTGLATELSKAFGSERVSWVQAIDWASDIDSVDAVEAAKDADVVVLCLGERPSVEKPGDIDDLTLSALQIELTQRIAETGTPIVLVLLQDRPRIISAIEPLCEAILLAYRPGPEGGRALASILSGAENPSGRLPFTYPRHSNSLVPYDHARSEELTRDYGLGQEIAMDAFDPQFSFGSGLSYTRYEYSDLKVSQQTLAAGDVADISVRVRNVGTRKGREVVQLYVSDQVASVPPPVKRLRDFEAVNLAPGQETTVTFRLSVDDLAFTNTKGVRQLEPGGFVVAIGELTAGFEVGSLSRSAPSR